MASGANYYLLTSLPPLDELGTPPPLSAAELRARAAHSNAAPIVDVILLADDLRQRQALLAGELSEVEGAVLTPGQMAGEEPLPDALPVAEVPPPPRLADDLVWEAYWRHAARVARRHRSRFLRGWVRVEVALRNGLTAARARALGESAEGREVTPELGGSEGVVEDGVAAWTGADDPLTGWRSLLTTRWQWTTSEERRFSFSGDEVAAYAVKLLLLRDWHRTMGEAA
jgi:hypothetical protein